jgi:hypothetical protein
VVKRKWFWHFRGGRQAIRNNPRPCPQGWGTRPRREDRSRPFGRPSGRNQKWSSPLSPSRSAPACPERPVRGVERVNLNPLPSNSVTTRSRSNLSLSHSWVAACIVSPTSVLRPSGQCFQNTCTSHRRTCSAGQPSPPKEDRKGSFGTLDISRNTL